MKAESLCTTAFDFLVTSLGKQFGEVRECQWLFPAQKNYTCLIWPTYSCRAAWIKTRSQN